MKTLHPSFELKLHAHGLTKLQDPNWTGTVLYDRLKRHVRRRIEPHLLWNFTPDGFLLHLGIWLFEDMLGFDDPEMFKGWDNEKLIWFMTDISEILVASGVRETNVTIARILYLGNEVDELFAKSEASYFFRLSKLRKELISLHEKVGRKFRSNLERLSRLYAQSYAERVFHDRQLCGFISELLVAIGFDGDDSVEGDQEPKQWVERKSIPKWAKDAVVSRDRGKCSICRVDITSELEADENFDHIVAIANGGCNDLVNLQLLCRKCNRKKYVSKVSVNSSIPKYFKWASNS